MTHLQGQPRSNGHVQGGGLSRPVVPNISRGLQHLFTCVEQGRIQHVQNGNKEQMMEGEARGPPGSRAEVVLPPLRSGLQDEVRGDSGDDREAGSLWHARTQGRGR